MNAVPKIPEPISTVEVEQAILGGLLLFNDLWGRCASILAVEDFSEPIHQAIFSAIGDLIGRGVPATPVSVMPFLPKLDDKSPAPYLSRLVSEVSGKEATALYFQMLKDFAGRREIDAVLSSFLESGGTRDLRRSASEIAGDMLTDLRDILDRSTGEKNDTSFAAGPGALALVDDADAIRTGQLERNACSTGFSDIDRMTGGYEAGLLWIIGARPSQGKTTHMIASARRVAAKAMRGQEGGAGVLVFSLEDDRQQAFSRLLADAVWSPHSPLSYSTIYRGKDLTEEDVARLRRAAQGIEQMPLTMDFRSNPTIASIAGRIAYEKRQLARRGLSLGVVFIDYLDFIKATDRYAGNRNLEKGQITKALKNIARDEQVCIVCYSQLSRAAEDGVDRRPQLRHLRDSGEIEQDGNVIGFLHRESYYIERSPEYRRSDEEAHAAFTNLQNSVEFIIAKNKTGPIGICNLWCDMAASSMSDPAYGGNR